MISPLLIGVKILEHYEYVSCNFQTIHKQM
jgi:hypothetical protein